MTVHQRYDIMGGGCESVAAASQRVLQLILELAAIMVAMYRRMTAQPRLQAGYLIPGRAKQGCTHGQIPQNQRRSQLVSLCDQIQINLRSPISIFPTPFMPGRKNEGV